VAGQNGSSNYNDQLIAAAMDGDAAAVRQCLEKGANIEFRDRVYGNTALTTAA
jgi:ankyrin repeat protein